MKRTVLQTLIDHFQFDQLPVEGTFYKSTYRSGREFGDGSPMGTGIIAMFCEEPLSVSRFHRLTHDEIWHFYGGDPLVLYLLYDDGSSAEIIMGNDPLQGHYVQYVVPANVWQAGCIKEGGCYSLYGCTMAPGFTDTCFEGAITETLIVQYPDRADVIKKLSVNGHVTHMPEGYAI